jgi:hypothetical protein
MSEELRNFLSKFLKKKIKFIFRGNSLNTDFSSQIPDTWNNLLSPNISLETSIINVWETVMEYNENFVKSLAKKTEDVFLIVDPAEIKPLGIFYAICTEGQNRKNYWLGGIPTTENVISDREINLGIQLPSSYKIFSKVHNGFLYDGLSEVGIRPLTSLYYLDELKINYSDEINYDPKKTLGFCGDGGGNEQCYLLDYPKENLDYVTCDWDHETRKLGSKESFWDFLQRFVFRTGHG